MRELPQVEQARRHVGGGHEPILDRRHRPARQGNVVSAGSQRISR